MKLCIVSDEYFGVTKSGGYGRLARTFAEEFSKFFDVSVVTPSLHGKSRHICLNGVEVYEFPSNVATQTGVDGAVGRIVRKLVKPDIVHIQALSVLGFQCVVRRRSFKVVVTAQDPPVGYAWNIWKSSNLHRRFKRRHLWLTGHWGVLAPYYCWMRRVLARNADLLASQTQYHIWLLKEKYGLKYTPSWLPNPTHVPNHKFRKADEPTVLFLGRWDRVKRPWLFFKIARRMPDARFICLGKGRNRWEDKTLRHQARKIVNLEYPGHVDPSSYLERSWVLVNCSLKESLPMSFLEALAYRVPIVSCNNMDGFASRFGVPVRDGLDVDEYVAALKFLLGNDDVREWFGEDGYRYVKTYHSTDAVVKRHLQVYRRLLDG